MLSPLLVSGNRAVRHGRSSMTQRSVSASPLTNLANSLCQLDRDLLVLQPGEEAADGVLHPAVGFTDPIRGCQQPMVHGMGLP